MSCSSTGSASKASLVRRCATRWRAISDRSSAGDRSSWRWAKRSAAAPDGCCCRGRRATASSSTSGPRIIAIHWRAARRFSRSICTSTPITWTSAPRRRATSTRSWTSFAGTTCSDYSFKRQMVEVRRATQGNELNQEEIIMRGVHVLAICAMATIGSAASAQEIDWKKVDEAIGRSAAVVSGDVHRYGFPRSDLTVTLDGVTIRPALALGGWAAFKPIRGGAMVMGDLVLLDTEVNPVMAKLIENGIEITAVHNHVLRGNPGTYYMHISGHGDPVKLATAIRAGLAASKTPLTPPAAPASPPAIDLDTAQLDQIIGVKGQAVGGVYQFGVPRRDPVSESGTQLSPAGPTGVATAIGFQPTGGGKAAITGDFVLTGEEVNPVIKALRENGIEVTAIHSHMLTEQPRLIFMHFWANDDAVKLAKGLRAALDKTASAKS